MNNPIATARLRSPSTACGAIQEKSSGRLLLNSEKAVVVEKLPTQVELLATLKQKFAGLQRTLSTLLDPSWLKHKLEQGSAFIADGVAKAKLLQNKLHGKIIKHFQKTELSRAEGDAFLQSANKASQVARFASIEGLTEILRAEGFAEAVDEIAQQVQKIAVNQLNSEIPDQVRFQTKKGFFTLRFEPDAHSGHIVTTALRCLGEGASKIFFTHYSEHGVKAELIGPKDLHESQSLEREYKLSQKLRSSGCQDVIQIHSYREINSKQVAYQAELCRGGDLSKAYVNSKTPPSSEQLAKIGMQLFRGLKTFHDLGYVHRDLKPDNLLLTANNGDIRIADLGTVSMHGERDTFAGTPAYTDPATLFKTQVLDKQSDIWSCGVVLYEIKYGTRLFGECKTAETMRAKAERISKELLSSSDPVDQLIAKMLQINPQDRPSATALYAQFTCMYNLTISTKNL